MAAFGARPVSCGQRDRFVKEEQFGVAPRLHDLPATAAEFQHAHEPTANLMTPDQDEVVVMQHAPVAVHGPAVLGGDQLPDRGYPVPQRTGKRHEPVAIMRTPVMRPTVISHAFIAAVPRRPSLAVFRRHRMGGTTRRHKPFGRVK
jgi:hypothetical protein